MPRTRTPLFCCAALAARAALAADPVVTIELDPWLAGIERAESVLAAVDGYSLIFHKREMLENVLRPEESMEMKFQKPFSVYMKWINEKGKGGEAIFVRGWNKDRIRVHPGGIWGIFNFNLEPTHKRIMKQNRHPITWVGLETIVGMVSDNVHRGMLHGQFTSVPHGETEIFGRRALVLEGVLPSDPSLGYYCYRTIVSLDVLTGLPVRICNFDWTNRLVEQYSFQDIRLDVRLTAKDFDPVNPDYRF